jgi:hypothetical protein
MDSWLIDGCRKVALRCVLAWGLVTACGLAFCGYNSRYIRNFLSGPFHMQEADLLEVKDPDTAPRYFVRVSGSRTIETGIQEITTEKRNGTEVSRRVSGIYYALLTGEHWLIVKSESGMPTNVEGSLETMPSNLYAEVFSTPEDKRVAAYFYPFYLDATGFRYVGYWGIVVGAFYLLILFYYVRRPLRWLQDPMTHPVMQRVKQWGEPFSVSREVERELEHHKNFKYGRFTFTDKYLVEKAFFQFNIFRFEDLLWAYKHVTQRRVYYVIPAGSYYHAIFVFYGGSAQVPLSEKDLETTLLFAANKAPWAVIGYTKELSDLFKKRTQEFCLAVEARRQALQR